MRMNEVKKTIEQIVRVEYIAEDGEVFTSKEECEKYEESALCVISKQLRRLDNGKVSAYNIFCGEASEEDTVEIFDIQTEDELVALKRYLYLKIRKNGASDKSASEVIGNMDKLTYGHEIIVEYGYDMDYCWVYGDGSISGLCEEIRRACNKAIGKEEVVPQ